MPLTKVQTKCFEERVARTCPKNSNWCEFVALVEAKMAGSHYGTFPRDLLKGLVARTSPLLRHNDLRASFFEKSD